jgi:hypothetical protein
VSEGGVQEHKQVSDILSHTEEPIGDQIYNVFQCGASLITESVALTGELWKSPAMHMHTN